MYKQSGLFFACAVALVLQGCAVSSTNEVVKPGVQKSGFMGLSKTADVKVSSPKALKNQSDKVVIGSFKVGFLTDGKAAAVAKGGYFSTSASSGKASARVHLLGISTEDLQKIADQIYNDFVAQLQAKGYTVIAAADLVNDAAYNALTDLGTASPEENVVINMIPTGKLTYVAPDSQKLIYYIGEKKAAFAISIKTIQQSQALADATGANVLAVNYIVNFAGADSHGGYTTSASVKVGQSLRVVAGSSVTFYRGKKDPTAVLTLGQPVASDETFATIDNITSKAGKALGTAVNVASALLGGGTSQSEEYNFNADAAKYSTEAVKVAKQANEKFIAQLAQARQQ